MNATDDNVARVSAERLRDFIADAFVAAGLPEADARVLGELIAEADLRGTDTHGVFRMPLYVRRIKAGGVNPRPDIRVIEERPSTALLDGDNGMGHLVMRRAAELAIAKAKQNGVGWVGARMSNHAGPAALYAMMPLAHDMIGLYFAVGSNNHLPPTGSAEALLGTNPIAVAIPAGEEPAVVMDMAPTVAAFGKVRLKAAQGEPMPVGWMIDHEGKPLTDASRAAEGHLLPIGDYKGYALSLIIGLLAGSLNGAAFGRSIVDFLKNPATCDQHRAIRARALGRGVRSGRRVQEERRRGGARHPRVAPAPRRRAGLAARRAEPLPPPRSPRARRSGAADAAQESRRARRRTRHRDAVVTAMETALERIAGAAWIPGSR